MPLRGNSTGAAMRSGTARPPCLRFPAGAAYPFTTPIGRVRATRRADPRRVANPDDVGDVLVGLRGVLGQQLAVLGAHEDALAAQLLRDVPSGERAHGLLAAHDPSGPVAGGPEGFAHRLLGADGDEGVASHVAGDEHGLPDGAIALGDVGMPGREGPRGALAVDDELTLNTV